jgi:hypothetical protein
MMQTSALLFHMGNRTSSATPAALPTSTKQQKPKRLPKYQLEIVRNILLTNGIITPTRNNTNNNSSKSAASRSHCCQHYRCCSITVAIIGYYRVYEACDRLLLFKTRPGQALGHGHEVESISIYEHLQWQ